MNKRVGRLLLCGLCVVGAFLIGSIGAQADSISGDLKLWGLWLPTDASGNFTSMGSADGIDVLGDQAQVYSVSGDFADHVSVGDIGTYNDLIFDPFTPTDLWSVGGFDFRLESANVDYQSNMFLALSGAGTVTGHGLDPTNMDWNFDGGWFVFSNHTEVPEAATLVLFCTGIGGVLLAARRERRRV